jgi:menaquinone reductase, iron-sulfur cluster-binding subunit
MDSPTTARHRYGMVIDLDKCSGCGICTMACAVDHNIAPAEEKATSATGVAWMRVYSLSSKTLSGNEDVTFIPMMCQQCGHDAPCVSVCPQNAVDVDPETGIVSQIPQRCLGCRYCMTACPYHARSFNWWDPAWPAGMEVTLNPDVAPRMRGVVEKCTFCHDRLHAAREKAAMKGSKQIDPADYVPSCVENCPTQAIAFGDLADESSPVALLARDSDSFRMMASLGTEPGVYYRSARPWVKAAAAGNQLATSPKQEAVHGS